MRDGVMPGFVGPDGRPRHAVCPSCGSADAAHILSLAQAPVMVATVFADVASARSSPAGDVELLGCRACGLLFNARFDLERAEAGARYESSQAASPHFSAFTKQLSQDWVDRFGLRGQRVIEVGCGQGDFMGALLAAGAGEVLGIDPVGRYVQPTSDRITMDSRSLCAAHVDVPGAALVCRHTLEHVPDVAGFLDIVAAWSRRHGDAPVLFEVPATERIVTEVAFWDVFYEHCSYFTSASLRHAFERAGFDVLRQETAYAGQYLLLEARAGTAASTTSRGDAAAWISHCLAFGRRASDTVGRCASAMRQMARDPGGLVIWQGAAKTVGLLTAVGPDAGVRFAVDQNSRRHGQHLPPFGVEVRPPASLAEARPAHVLLMNPVYEAEVRQQLDAMGLATTRLHTMDSLASAGA